MDGLIGADLIDEVEAPQSVLFKGCRMFLAREVPREMLLFVIRSCSGEVGWDGPGSPFSSADEDITHEIIDRPTQKKMILSRDYVQPQWIFDSVNSGVLLPCHEYMVGVKLPPHLSPFIDNEKLGYIPRRAKELSAYSEGKSLADIEWSEDEGDEVMNEDEEEAVEAVGSSNSTDDESDGSQDTDGPSVVVDEEEGEEEVEIGEKRKRKEAEDAEVEEADLAKMMMSKKHHRLYNRMQYGLNKNSEVNENLRTKRRKKSGQ